jgi:hypothetical protein
MLLAMKGSSAQQEIEDAARELARRRLRAEVVTSTVPGASSTTVVRVVAAAGPALGWDGSSRRGGRKRA